jgi:dTDP-glucose 4,6-dehydratase
MQPFLVTGGAGFIGFNLVKHLLAATTRPVVVVDKLTYAASPAALRELEQLPRVTVVRADIADPQAMASVFATCRPAAVVNLAAETHVDRSIDAPGDFIQTNVVGTFVLLEQARRLVATLGREERAAFRFLHVSTDEVFGTLGPTGRFAETTPYAPNSPYAASKASADHLVGAYFNTYGLPTIVTNCSNNYGPYQHAEKLIPLMTLNALQGRRLPVYGDGTNVRDWLHVGDHCSALLRVLDRGRPGESYNVGASNEQTNLQLIDTLCGALEHLLPATENPSMVAAGARRYVDLKQFVADRPGHDRRYAVDASKLRSELGWTPTYTFAAGLRETVRWYVEHHEAFAAEVSGYDRQRLGLGTVPA